MTNSSIGTTSQPRSSHALRGVRKYIENNDIAGLMQELDKVDTGTKEAIPNKISISDGNGGRIELDGHQMVTMPDWMLAEVAKRSKKTRNLNREMVLELSPLC
jgi:hypothetical protein